MDMQRTLGILSVALYIYAFLPYFKGIYKDTVRPHVFTWLLWTVLSAITYVAQMTANAGAGAWFTLVNVVICFGVAVYALRKGNHDITRSDWVSLTAAILIIPVWIMTKSPLGAVILVCVIDSIAFCPTFRKAWTKPREEAVITFFVSGISALVSIAAIDDLNAVTVTYPLYISVSNWVLSALILIRRKHIKI